MADTPPSTSMSRPQSQIQSALDQADLDRLAAASQLTHLQSQLLANRSKLASLVVELDFTQRQVEDFHSSLPQATLHKAKADERLTELRLHAERVARELAAERKVQAYLEELQSEDEKGEKRLKAYVSEVLNRDAHEGESEVDSDGESDWSILERSIEFANPRSPRSQKPEAQMSPPVQKSSPPSPPVVTRPAEPVVAIVPVDEAIKVIPTIADEPSATRTVRSPKIEPRPVHPFQEIEAPEPSVPSQITPPSSPRAKRVKVPTSPPKVPTSSPPTRCCPPPAPVPRQFTLDDLLNTSPPLPKLPSTRATSISSEEEGEEDPETFDDLIAAFSLNSTSATKAAQRLIDGKLDEKVRARTPSPVGGAAPLGSSPPPKHLYPPLLMAKRSVRPTKPLLVKPLALTLPPVPSSKPPAVPPKPEALAPSPVITSPRIPVKETDEFKPTAAALAARPRPQILSPRQLQRSFTTLTTVPLPEPSRSSPVPQPIVPTSMSLTPSTDPPRMPRPAQHRIRPPTHPHPSSSPETEDLRLKNTFLEEFRARRKVRETEGVAEEGRNLSDEIKAYQYLMRRPGSSVVGPRPRDGAAISQVRPDPQRVYARPPAFSP